MKKINLFLMIMTLAALFSCEYSYDNVMDDLMNAPATQVIYNANGADRGAVPDDANNYKKDYPVTVLDNSGNLERDNSYFFTGWNTNADGSGINYVCGQTFSMGTSNVNLYANWRQGTFYTVTYNSGGGSGDVPVDRTYYESGTAVYVRGAGSLSKTGYVFGGWTKGGDTYAAGNSFVITTDVTLSAKWNPDIYSVIFYPNGGSGSMDSQYIPFGSWAYLNANTFAFPSGERTFAGWATTPAGEIEYSEGDIYKMDTAGAGLYAKWSPLDNTFGTGGISVIPVDASKDEYIYSVAIQDDDKIVVAGTLPGGFFAVVRCNPNGSPDTSFGGDGVVTFTSTGSDSGRAVVVQSDGRIVVAGISNGIIGIARFNTNGSPDALFSGGFVSTKISAGYDVGNSVAIQSDNKIVVAGGENFVTNGFSENIAVVRYNADGLLDTKTDSDPSTWFGSDGYVITDLNSSANDSGNSVAIQPDGRIVVAGVTGIVPNTNIAVVRYNTDGSLDTSFDGDGTVITDLNSSANDSGNSVVIQSDGKIVVAGTSGGDFAVARYNTDGSRDSTFGKGGRVITGIGRYSVDRGFSAVIQPNGRIVVAGLVFNGTDNDFAVVRYNTDGSLDRTLDDDGIIYTRMGTSFYELNAVGLQSNGKIIVAGTRYNGSNYDFAVVRYWP